VGIAPRLGLGLGLGLRLGLGLGLGLAKRGPMGTRLNNSSCQLWLRRLKTDGRLSDSWRRRPDLCEDSGPV